MADYIEREALKNQIAKNKLMAREPAAKRILAMIDDMPAADVAPVVHGHWDKPTKPFPYWDWKCSVCGCEEYRQRDSHGHYRIMKYCPNCGAKMDDEVNDDR